MTSHSEHANVNQKLDKAGKLSTIISLASDVMRNLECFWNKLQHTLFTTKFHTTK